MESSLNYKDCDIKYVYVRVPESCLKLGCKTGFQPTSVCLRCYLCIKTVLNILYEISGIRIVLFKLKNVCSYVFRKVV